MDGFPQYTRSAACKGFWVTDFGVRASAVAWPPNGLTFPAARSDSRGWTSTNNRADAPIVTFHRAAPACCGAFADARRVVAATKAGGSTNERPRRWSRRSRAGHYGVECERAIGRAGLDLERIALAS
jgi:hypothetical protein